MDAADIDRTGDLGHLFHLVVSTAGPRSLVSTPPPALHLIFTKILLMPEETALQRLADLAIRGRAVLMTCERAQADLVHDQIKAHLAHSPLPPSLGLRFSLERVWARPN